MTDFELLVQRLTERFEGRIIGLDWVLDNSDFEDDDDPACWERSQARRDAFADAIVDLGIMVDRIRSESGEGG